MNTYKFFKSLNEKIKQYEKNSKQTFNVKNSTVTIVWIEDVKKYQ